MTRSEYTYLWWEGSATPTSNGRLGPTTPPMSEEIIDKLNTLGTDGWEIDHITAAPLTTGWISPRGGTAAAGFTDKVHYLAVLKRILPHGRTTGNQGVALPLSRQAPQNGQLKAPTDHSQQNRQQAPS